MCILLVIHLVWSLGALFFVPREQRLPSSATAWTALIVLLPVVGTLFYLLFAPRRVSVSAPRTASRGDALERIITRGCGSRPALHNRTELLHNGNNAFSALITSLQRATESIHMEYYIFRDDRIGRTIADILSRKARSGVEVRLIYDALGSWHLGWRILRSMRRSGVQLAAWEPLRFPWFTRRITRRNHRKIVVTDGRTAFVGGINIAKYYLDGDDLGRWRDEHLRIEGDAVADLQKLFFADWEYATGERLDPARYIARHTVLRRSVLHIAWAETGFSRLTLVEAFSAAICRARQRVRICTPYLVPPSMLMDAIRLAAGAGVRVQILIPRASDSLAVDLLSESYAWDLLGAGVEIYRYDNGFLHSKLLVIDDCVASVGTANMDYRSLLDNIEVTAFIRDREQVRELCELFDRDRKTGRRLVMGEWQRPLWRRVVGDLLRFAAPLV